MAVSYGRGTSTAHPLRGADLDVGVESVAVMGPSGSGKSTLLRVLAGLQAPTRGEVTLDGTAVGRTGRVPSDIALIHQDYRLVDFLTAEENVDLAMELRGVQRPPDAASTFLESVGVGHCADRRPPLLSGGEQQRVAIARAVACGCRVLLADEPTGALDRDTSIRIAELLTSIADDRQVSVVVATHDHDVAAMMTRVVLLDHGVLRDRVP